ncbi:MAG: hypothetical protein WBG74_01640 [Shewanella sp.]|uniref:hypothetical protein n=1 Tax=Shewanella sp. TaxID=50422 RepID=UPI003C725147
MSQHTEFSAYPMMQLSTLDKLKSDLGSDTYQHLLVLFEQELKQLHADISAAVDNHAFQAINNATHILKNTAALYVAERLSQSASFVYQLNAEQSYIPATLTLINIIDATLIEYKVHISSIAE